jgi:hypothetical protein
MHVKYLPRRCQYQPSEPCPKGRPLTNIEHSRVGFERIDLDERSFCSLQSSYTLFCKVLYRDMHLVGPQVYFALKSNRPLEAGGPTFQAAREAL